MARRSNATWVFLALVFGGAAVVIARSMHAPEPGAASSPSSSGSASAPPIVSGFGTVPPKPQGSARSRWFAEADQRAADPAALPLLGGLQLGAEVLPGWQLVGVSGVRDGRIELLLDRRGEVGMVVWIEKKADKHAPLETTRYGISYGGVHPIDVVASEQAALAKAVRDRVAQSEGTAPVPPGL